MRVLALAQHLRMADGAASVEADHMEQAIDRPGLDVAETVVGDAPTSRTY